MKIPSAVSKTNVSPKAMVLYGLIATILISDYSILPNKYIFEVVILKTKLNEKRIHANNCNSSQKLFKK